MPESASALPLAQRIRSVRGQKVMLASDLAALYGVQAKALIQAVERNLERFPPDFAFQLSDQEVRVLRSQIVTLDETPLGRGKYAKYARSCGFAT
ncbi:MAG: ORF6N domain-containing protein [Phycisphaerales bacterium]|nr:ORF6N domain-containing protein [Phycisphaerales bacterium]